MTFIYLLIDPVTSAVRYVGKTNNPRRRFNQELSEARRNPNGTRRNSWIKNLLDRGFKPEQFIIDIVPTDEWAFWEIHYIGLFKTFGYILTNHSNGGCGPNSVSAETRKKLSTALKGNTNKRGTKLSDDTKLKLSDIAKGRINTLESRKKVSKSVLQFDKKNVFLREWLSGKEAAKKLNINQANLNLACNNKRKSAGGYIWKFKN